MTDIAGDFVHADMIVTVHKILEGTVAELIVKL